MGEFPGGLVGSWAPCIKLKHLLGDRALALVAGGCHRASVLPSLMATGATAPHDARTPAPSVAVYLAPKSSWGGSWCRDKALLWLGELPRATHHWLEPSSRGGGQRFLANPGLEAVPCARLLGFGRGQLCTGGTLEAAAWRCHLLGDNKRHGQKWGLVAWGEGRAGWGMGHPAAWVLSGSRMDLGAHGTGGALWWQGAPRVLHSSWRAPSHHPHPSWGAKPPKMGSFSLYFWLFRGPETPREGQECPPAL